MSTDMNIENKICRRYVYDVAIAILPLVLAGCDGGLKIRENFRASTNLAGHLHPGLRMPLSSGIAGEPTKINSCREISQPGNYYLGSDLIVSSSLEACISVKSAANVNIDCSGHSIEASGFKTAWVKITNSQQVTLANCDLLPNTSQPDGSLIVDASSDVTIRSSRIGGGLLSLSSIVAVKNSQSVSILKNNITAVVSFSSTSNSRIEGNKIVSPGFGFSQTPPTVVGLTFGSGNQVRANFIDGRAKVIPGDMQASLAYGGADDGIVGNFETGTIIEGNTIVNVWDAAIEGVGTLDNCKINGNKIDGAAVCAIGGWYGNFARTSNDFKMNGCSITSNLAAHVGSLFMFSTPQMYNQVFSSDTLVQASLPTNTFSGNQVVTQIPLGGPSGTYVSAAQIQADYLHVIGEAMSSASASFIAEMISSGFTTRAQFMSDLFNHAPPTALAAVAVELSMYGQPGTPAEIDLLLNTFMPPQIAVASQYGYNPTVYVSEALGLVFAFNNETGSTAFINDYGPTKPSMPNSPAGDQAFAAAAVSAIFQSAATPHLTELMNNWVANWKNYFTANGIPGIDAGTPDQIDIAARGTAWGDAVGVALDNGIGPLPAKARAYWQ